MQWSKLQRSHVLFLFLYISLFISLCIYIDFPFLLQGCILFFFLSVRSNNYIQVLAINFIHIQGRCQCQLNIFSRPFSGHLLCHSWRIFSQQGYNYSRIFALYSAHSTIIFSRLAYFICFVILVLRKFIWSVWMQLGISEKMYVT